MAKDSKYGLASLKQDFPTDGECLDFIFDALHSRECSCGGRYARIRGRKEYQCSRCRFHISPTAGTVFHKSSTPLTLWFHAIWIFANAKSGISASELERQLEVTYKTAWRMLGLIRGSLADDTTKLQGKVEIDTAYMGGVGHSGPYYADRAKMMREKAIVIAAAEREGAIVAKVIESNKGKDQAAFLEKHVEPLHTQLMTDTTSNLDSAAKGYDRYAVNHSKHEYARGDVHINTVEAYWSHVKRSIRGTHKSVSKQHLQSYLDGFSFHWSNPGNGKHRFSVLLGSVVSASRE